MGYTGKTETSAFSKCTGLLYIASHETKRSVVAANKEKVTNKEANTQS